MNYRYDGTFFGFISAVVAAYEDGIGKAGQIHCGEALSLFDEEQLIVTDMARVQRLLGGLQRQCGGKSGHFLYYAFLAEQPHREEKLFSYIRQAFRYKEEFLHHLSEPSIWEVRKWASRTANERHRLLGLLRFRELEDGLLYSEISPDCSVVPVMAPHFVRRLPEERWVIHDVRRHFGVYYDRKEINIVEIPKLDRPAALSAQEEEFQALWRRYYDTIAIKERRNTKLRRQFMPKKYWPYLIELS